MMSNFGLWLSLCLGNTGGQESLPSTPPFVDGDIIDNGTSSSRPSDTVQSATNVSAFPSDIISGDYTV